MKLCAIEPKELEEKILTRFAENQNDELLEDLSDYVINSQKEIERLNKKIEQYENPEDMTLMFMWCDEKAKDEIKRLNKELEEKEAILGGIQQLEAEIERLNNIIEKLEQENAVLKTQVVNKDKYSYGIRMGSDKE